MLRSRTIREGTVGLLLLLGVGLFAVIGLWLRGFTIAKNSYNLIVEFPNVKGIQTGATVRYRGLEIGKIKTITPGINSVDVIIEVNSNELRLPKKVQIVANRSGLIGESSIDITPLTELPDSVKAIQPTSSECTSSEILCNNDRLQGEPGITFDELLPTMARLTNLYSDPKFYSNLQKLVENTSTAATSFTSLSKELALLSKDVRQNLKTFSGTAEAFTNLANQTSREVPQTSEKIGAIATQLSSTTQQFARTADSIATLANNVNSLVNENRGSLVKTLNSISNTSNRLGDLVTNMNSTVKGFNAKIESTDTNKLIKNLETLTANAVDASANLKDISTNFNQPKNLLLLQQTLDSARATFENAQKITADLDELTGDPSFRENVRLLVNGLSKLVSSTEELDRQVQTARVLEPMQQDLQEKY
jgi:phospholipid/cholesterol/gamma-HCH transport system substrate-binding protein